MQYFDILFLIGRVFLGGYFLMMGLNHFSKTAMLTNYAQSKGMKNPKSGVLFGGILLLLGGAGIFLGVYIQWAVLMLVLFLLGVSFRIHTYWKEQDVNMKMADMSHFLKNIALIGACLTLLAIPQPWVYSIPLG